MDIIIVTLCMHTMICVHMACNVVKLNKLIKLTDIVLKLIGAQSPSAVYLRIHVHVTMFILFVTPGQRSIPEVLVLQLVGHMCIWVNTCVDQN